MDRSISRKTMRASATALVIALIAAACGGAPPAATSAATAAPSAAPAAAGTARPATPAPLVQATLSVSHPTGGAHLPLFYGRDKGIFAKYGLTMTLNPLGGGAPAMAALISGQTQIADITGSEVVSATAAGADLVVIGVLTPVYPYVLMSNTDIKTTADLKGKTIVIKAVGDATDIATRLSLQKLGLVPDVDVTILAVNVDNARLAVLVAKQACCTPGQPRDQIAMIKQGGFKVLYDLASLGLLNSQGALVLKRDFFDKNPQVVQQFMDALIESIAAAKKDRPGALEVIKKQLDLKDDEIAIAEYDYFMGKVVPTYPYARPEMFNDAIKVLSETNSKVLTVVPAKFVNRSIVESSETRGIGK